MRTGLVTAAREPLLPAAQQDATPTVTSKACNIAKRVLLGAAGVTALLGGAFINRILPHLDTEVAATAGAAAVAAGILATGFAIVDCSKKTQATPV